MNLNFKSLIILVLLFAMSVMGASQSPVYNNPKPDEFLKIWKISSITPFPKDSQNLADEEQKFVFDTDLLKDFGGEANIDLAATETKNKLFIWKTVQTKSAIIDLVKEIGEKDYTVVYAYAEINADKEQKIVLGVGSDDGIKVWLNGKQIHSHWVGRGITPDEDIIPCELQKGKNRLLLKVQNMQQGWGFACRILGVPSLTNRLGDAAALGNMDDLQMLVNYGADVNGPGFVGLTAFQTAKIKGRTDVVKWLADHGANIEAPMPSPAAMADGLFSKTFHGITPGVSVLVARDGNILYSKGFGYENMSKKIPATAETKYRIGSVTKQFTAAAILKLQEEGKINVNDKLSKYIPDFPRGDEVTIHMLLTHISGIHSFTDEPNFVANVVKGIDSKTLIEEIKTYPYDFNPGEKWHYNNSGYFILGYLVEQLSGMPYNDYLNKTFFQPLDMKNTGVHYKNIKLENESLGYQQENNQYDKTLDWDMSWAGGAGNMYSTVGDLYKWNEGIFNGKVLTQDEMRAAFTPVTLNDGSVAQVIGKYGYGWVINSMRGQMEINHGGGLHGFSTFLMRLPMINATVVVISNCLPQPLGFSPEFAAHNLAEMFFYTDLEDVKSFTAIENLSSELLKEYEGQYDYGTGILTVTTRDNRLYAVISGQSEAEIFCSSPDQFFWKIVDAQISFKRDEQGKITHVIHHQSGQVIDAPKIETLVEIKVDPAIYKEYVGEYELQPGFILTVTAEGDHIYTQATGQGKVEIFPKTENEFFLKIVNARIVFNRETKVVSLTLFQNGQEMVAKKIK